MKYTLLLICCSLFVWNSQAQVTTEGKEFWLGFIEVEVIPNLGVENSLSLKLFITSKSNANGTVSIPRQNWSIPFFVNANQTISVNIPSNLAHTLGSETVQNNGIYVKSNADISVFAIAQSNRRTEASAVLPVSSLGGTTEYIIPSYQGIPDLQNESHSEFLIVALKDDTDILITPTAKTRNGKPENVPFTISLDSGQVYQVQSERPSSSLPDSLYDLTGTSIVGANGCKPFAVFAGVTAVLMPDENCLAWQHLYEQIFPLSTWGKDYTILPFAGMTFGYVYRIIASQDNTTISINNGSGNPTTITLNKGKFYEQNITQAIDISKGICIQADKPIAVAQFMKGQACNGVSPNNNRGDPAMIMLNPNNQTVKQITFNTISSTVDNLNSHFVNVLMHTTDIQKLKLDGNLISSSLFKVLGGCTNLSYAQIDLTQYGIDPILGKSFTLSSDSTFIAYAYGYGDASGYAYSVGASFENQNYNFTPTPPTVCISNSVTFKGVGSNVISYSWDFGDGSPIQIGQNVTHTYTIPNTYQVKMTVTFNGGCGQDIITKPYTVLPYPDVNLGTDKTVCTDLGTILDAGSQVGSPQFQWTKNGVAIGGSTQILQVFEAGNYKVNITNAGGCSDSDEILISNYIITPVSINNLANIYCIDSPVTNLNGSPTNGIFQINGQIATQFRPALLGVGVHRVIYTFVNATGCTNRDTLDVTVHPLPVVSIQNLQEAYCIDVTPFNLSGTPTNGTFKINNTTVAQLNPAQLGAGTFDVVYTFQDANNCTNTASKTVKINPLPTLNFINLNNQYCIDAGLIPLQANVMGGIFKLNGNPTNELNTQVLGAGDFTLTYTYQDANTCENTISQDVKINPLPTPEITPLAPIYCKNSPIITPSATPSDGTFRLNGNLTTQINPANLSIGSHTLIYTFTDVNTCTQRDTIRFEIEATPEVEVTGLQFLYCIDANPFDLTASPANGEAGTGIFTIDGGTPVTQVNPAQLGAGMHTVAYIFTDARTNCTNSDTKTFQISALPTVSLVTIGGLADAYCLNIAPFSMAGLGNPSGGIFTIDGVVQTIFNPQQLGAGIHTVIYNYQDANGCFNTASKNVLIREPVALDIPNLTKSNYCVQAPAFGLVGTPNDGTFVINGNVIQDKIFNPATLGIGTHQVLYTNTTSCDTLIKEVNVLPPPVPLNYPDLEICSFSGDTVILDAGVGEKYQWNTSATTQSIKITQSGTYTVIVTDSLNCTTENTLLVLENCNPRLFIPTAFSPNGDGLNDVLEIFGGDFNKFEILIFNRWGEIVFKSKNRFVEWNGMLGGRPAPEGVYIVKVQYRELPDGNLKSFNSRVTLVR